LTFFVCSGPQFAQNKLELTSLYIAAHVVSDAAPFWFEYLLDISPEGEGSRVRHVRIAPVASFCPSNVTIRGLEKSLNVPPNRLSTVSLCSMSINDYNRSVSRFTKKQAAIFDTVGYTVAAHCGKDERTFHVPYLETFDFEGFRKASPSAAAIVGLYSDIEKQVSPNEPINGTEHPRDYELQLTGQSFLPDLLSGHFDGAFDKGRLQEMLQQYQGPLKSVEPVPALVDAGKWAFVKLIDPEYPAVARMARIQGKVVLELKVDSNTGKVADVKVLSGPDLLQESATRAAEQWLFSPDQDLPPKITVTLDYSLACKLAH
jgi:TonB family protein